MSDDLDQDPIFTFVTKPIHLFGGERGPVLLALVPGAIAVAIGQTPLVAALAAALWFGGLWFVRARAKQDPQWFEIHRRWTQLQAYYPPQSTPFQVNTSQQVAEYEYCGTSLTRSLGRWCLRKWSHWTQSARLPRRQSTAALPGVGSRTGANDTSG